MWQTLNRELTMLCSRDLQLGLRHLTRLIHESLRRKNKDSWVEYWPFKTPSLFKFRLNGSRRMRWFKDGFNLIFQLSLTTVRMSLLLLHLPGLVFYLSYQDIPVTLVFSYQDTETSERFQRVLGRRLQLYSPSPVGGTVPMAGQ